MIHWDGLDRRKSDGDLMKLLTSMDKNLALLAQKSEAQTIILDKHIIDDAKIQSELQKSVNTINLRLAQWVGGGAVIMVIGQLMIKAWR